MHVVVTGASGLIGSALVPALRGVGHEVARLVRRPPPAGDEREWDPGAGRLDPSALADVDAVVHLAGEGIASGLWTRRRKQRILDSRVEGTGLIARTIARLDDGPKALVSASGINYYGDRGDVILDEQASKGSGFLADVVDRWESAANPAREAGTRVVHLRTGVSLVPRGGIGVLQVTRWLFWAGLGGRLGPGRQYWSWITLDDIVGAYLHALDAGDLEGPVNLTAPDPVTNAEYTETLARVLRRPAFVHVPAFLPKLVARELAQELLFTSIRATPTRLESSGYTFSHPRLEPALRTLLGRAGPGATP